MQHLLGFLPRTYEKMDRIPVLFEHAIHYEPFHPEHLLVLNSTGQWVPVDASKMRRGDKIITRSAYCFCPPHSDPELSLMLLLHDIIPPIPMASALKKYPDGCVVVSAKASPHTTQVHPDYPLPGHLVFSSLLAHGYSNVVMTPRGVYYSGVCIDPHKHISFVED